ncbi:7tm Odorant receptor [Nesidiocoris tenuis]|uniref:Odorant receptor n=1 Tax=Nesidiocoris tenuis TaxID=355587 RepID=A0ABN7AFD1_9HEMI|nr:7tm Odorant receptor [Nesidiocoris tenuis]
MSIRDRLIKSKEFKNNFGNFFIWSGIYCSTPLMAYFWLVFIGYHLILLTYSVTLVIQDAKLFGECAHFAVFRFSCFAVICNSLFYIKRLETLFVTFNTDQVYDYENTLSDNSTKEVESIRRKYAERKSFYANGFFKTVTGALATFWLRTILEYYFLHSDQLAIEHDDGINRDLPVPSYFPYDTSEWPLMHFTLLCEIILVVQSYLIVVAIDCSFICFAEDFLRELEIISLTLKDLYARSVKLRSENSRLSIQESLLICVNHSIRHHQKIIELFKCLYDYSYYVLFVLLGGGAFLICLSGLILTDDNIRVQDKSVFFMFLGNELFHIFILCYYGEQIIDKGNRIGDSLYESSWLTVSKYLKPYIVMINLRSQKPLALSGGGFIPANIDTYGTVLRTAYSCLNLLKATE